MTGLHESSLTQALATLAVDRDDEREGFSQLDLLRQLHILDDLTAVLKKAGWRSEGKQWFPPRRMR